MSGMYALAWARVDLALFQGLLKNTRCQLSASTGNLNLRVTAVFWTTKAQDFNRANISMLVGIWLCRLLLPCCVGFSGGVWKTHESGVS